MAACVVVLCYCSFYFFNYCLYQLMWLLASIVPLVCFAAGGGVDWDVGDYENARFYIFVGGFRDYLIFSSLHSTST